MVVDSSLQSEQTVEKADGDSFVEVMFAKSVVEACRCKRLLEDALIPARIETDSQRARLCGVAVLVPNERFVTASELLADMARDDDAEEVEGEEAEDEDDDFDDDYDDDDDFDDDLDDDEEEEEAEEAE